MGIIRLLKQKINHRKWWAFIRERARSRAGAAACRGMAGTVLSQGTYPDPTP